MFREYYHEADVPSMHMVEFPNDQPLSPRVLPRPLLTTRKAPERTTSKENAMTNPNNTGPSLADVDRAIANNGSLSPTRRRDLRSAISRVAALLGEDPARLPLDLAAIAGRLAAINPVAAGLTPKTLSNIRSDLLAAVRTSGLQPVLASSKAALSPPWADLLARLPAKRARIGLSRLARYASAAGITPGEINDPAIDRSSPRFATAPCTTIRMRCTGRLP